ncbi:holin [Actinomadura decatromicini]|uniref:Holin n=1 Tax=Actinomadura decatromicini TaxID=2604572 RepID=A0A5D3FH01_9ACTN|nr:holin [Actinomadura decatromicini]TYK47146.1 holin [Actinomadura decatromicini]
MRDVTRKEPMETKVKAAGFASVLASFVVAVAVTKAPVLAGASEYLHAAIITAITGAGTTAAGWLAAHTPRHPNRM